MKREKTYLCTLSFGAALNIAFSLLFGLVLFKENPAFGVALGTAIADGLVLLTMFALTWEHSKHILLTVNNIKIVVVAALLIASTILLDKYLVINGATIEEGLIYKILVIGLIDLVIYLVGCFIAKEKLVRSFFKRA